MSEAQRDAVWLTLPARLAALSVRVRMLPWTQGEIALWAADAIANGLGSWAVGGMKTGFSSAGEGEIEVQAAGGLVIARSRASVFRLRISEKVRAFAFTDGPIVLGLPKARAAMLKTCSTVETAGLDADAIDAPHQGDRLFDLGLGSQSFRLCLRTGDDEVASEISTYTGKGWSEAAETVERAIGAGRADLVAETAMARIELASPSGSHLLRSLRASGGKAQLPLELPDYALPVAAFYPSADAEWRDAAANQ